LRALYDSIDACFGVLQWETQTLITILLFMVGVLLVSETHASFLAFFGVLKFVAKRSGSVKV